MPPDETTTPTETAAPAEKPENESLSEAMRRLGGDSIFEETPKADAEPDAAPEAKADPAAKAPKATKADKEPDPKTDKRDQLRALATELGLALEDGKVTTTERVKLREERRANLAAINKAEQDAIAKVQAARAEWEPKIGKVEAFEAAVKAGDYDALAKLAGFDDWNKLQDDQIQRLADPNYKRVRELEERLKREDEEKARARAEAERSQATQAELQAQANHKRQLQQVMAESHEPLVKAMHDVPNFINAVFNVQRRVWQESGGRDVLTAEGALKWKPPEGGLSLWEELESFHKRVNGIFGAKAAPPPAGTPEKPKPRTTAPAAPAPAPRARAQADNGFTPEMRSRLAAAIEEDHRSARR